MRRKKEDHQFTRKGWLVALFLVKENYLFLEKHGSESYIKPQNHETKKTAKYKKQIGRAEHIIYDPGLDHYLCAQGRKLTLHRESTKDGLPKERKVRKQYEQYRAASEANINTEEGIYLRLC